MAGLAFFQNKHHVDFRDVDYTKKMKLSVLFDYLQDIASEHAVILGYGIDEIINKIGVTWVLLKIEY